MKTARKILFFLLALVALYALYAGVVLGIKNLLLVLNGTLGTLGIILGALIIGGIWALVSPDKKHKHKW